jgi:hypothetical protein
LLRKVNPKAGAPQKGEVPVTTNHIPSLANHIREWEAVGHVRNP